MSAGVYESGRVGASAGIYESACCLVHACSWKASITKFEPWIRDLFGSPRVVSDHVPCSTLHQTLLNDFLTIDNSFSWYGFGFQWRTQTIEIEENTRSQRSHRSHHSYHSYRSDYSDTRIIHIVHIVHITHITYITHTAHIARTRCSV